MHRFLFDRLCTPLQQVPTDEHSQLAALRASIREELQRLVSGRAYFDGIKLGKSGNKSVLNFGIDNPVEYGNSHADTKIIMDQILELVRNFEPRIRNPQVQLHGTGNKLMPATVEISGHIKADHLSEAFQHSVTLDGAY